MTAAKRPQVENKPSFLLSKDENEQLFKLIGPRCKSMASAVVQVCFADTGGRSQWSKRHCGVICFIKDNIRRSYFLRLFCLERQTVLWEQELYSSFEYKAARNYFHTFEGDECRVGFNFADEAEAEFYLAAVYENLRVKAEKRERRRQAQQQQQSMQAPFSKSAPLAAASNGKAPVPYQAPRPSGVSAPNIVTTSLTSKKNNKKDKNKKLTKADIGLPSDFKHVSHVGWDPNQGFALENVDPHLLQFFAKAGVSESQLQDKATRDFIYDFIDKHGGTEAIREIYNQSATTTSSAVGGYGTSAHFNAPPVPARNPPSTPQTTRTIPPAPPVAAPPPPPSRVVASPPSAPPAPPPPHRAPPPTKAAAPAAPMTANIPPPPPMNAAPPPPPLPIASATSNAPPPPPPPTAHHQAAQPDARSALMDAIRGGPKLKSVDPQEASRPKPAMDSRNDLLNQIRVGKELRPVETNKHAPQPAPVDESLEGMAGALARALENRFNVIHSDSDESGNEEDEDDDWDE